MKIAVIRAVIARTERVAFKVFVYDESLIHPQEIDHMRTDPPAYVYVGGYMEVAQALINAKAISNMFGIEEPAIY